jgi:hypothetical protein
METSVLSDKVLDLGRKLVEELGLDDSNDTLGRWMAHHLAELITRAENETGSAKVAAQKECFDAILALWRHRSELPRGKRPFEQLEPVIRAVESLDPEDDTPRYFRTPRPPKGEAAETSDQEKWLRIAEGLDYSAKVLIGFCLAEAARDALDESKEWVRLAKEIGDGGVPEIIIRLVSSSVDLDKAPDPNAAQRKFLAGRMKRLRGFIGIAESFVETLAKRLEELPAVEKAAEPEENVLYASPVVAKTPPQHRLKPKSKKTSVPKKRKTRKSRAK